MSRLIINKIEIIFDIHVYNKLLEKYTLKDTFTNNYLMAEQVSGLIENKNLTFLEGTRNLFFFVEQQGRGKEKKAAINAKVDEAPSW